MLEAKNNIVFKAIIIGFLVDTIGSILAGGIFGLFYGMYLAKQGIPQNEIIIALQSGMPMLIFGLVFGLAFTALGGYIAAKIASKNQVLHGAIIGAICVIASAASISVSSIPMWYTIVSIVFVIPFGIAGAVIAKNKQAKSVA